jgi:hypothetical protein
MWLNMAQLFVDNVDHIWHNSGIAQNCDCFSVDSIAIWSNVDTVGAVDSIIWQKMNHWLLLLLSYTLLYILFHNNNIIIRCRAYGTIFL